MLEIGKLVRFKWLDEAIDEGYLHIQDGFCTNGFPADPEHFALTSFSSKKTMQKADRNGDFERVEYIDLHLVRCGTRGMIVDYYEGLSCNWYNVLLKEKIVWTPEYNLVDSQQAIC